MKEILEKLWAVYRDRPFASFSIQRKLNLRADELTEPLNLLEDMSESGETRDGYQVRCVASLVYKLIKTQRDEDKPLKGLPLTPLKESHLGQTEKEKHGGGGGDPFPAVPQELKNLPQWVVWRYETRGGEKTKVPYQTHGSGAKANVPSTWTLFTQVCVDAHRWDGIGFEFSVDDPYMGIDLDKCLDENRKIKKWALPIVDRFKSVAYGEVSPSGTGIKFYTRAALPPKPKGWNKVYINKPTKEAIEIYDTGRFFVVTGKGKGEIGDGQAVVDWILSEYASLQAKPSQAKTPSQAKPSRAMSVDEIIDKIQASRQAAKFNALFGRDTTGFGSQSEADMALCSLLAFWTQEADEIDTIFRQSGLMRTKWDVKHRRDGATYGQMTIETALAGNRETYKPSRSRQSSKTNRRLWRDKQLYGRRF